MSELTVGVVRQDEAGERRVGLVPESVARLSALGLGTVVQEGAGAAAWFPDAEYAAAGATVVPDTGMYEQADVVVCIRPPNPARLREGQLLVGLLQPLLDPGLARVLAEAKVTAVSLDGLPRTLSRAQSMDALTSQANVAGYKAAVLAADALRRVLPDADDRGRHGPAGHGARARRRGGRACRRSAPRAGWARWSPATTSGEAARADIASTRRAVAGPRRRPSRRPAKAATPASSRDRGAAPRSRRAMAERDRPLRRRHHHRAGAGPTPPRAGHRRGARGDAPRLGGGRPGGRPAGRQRDGLGARTSTLVTDERRDGDRRRQPAVAGAAGRLDGVRPQHRRAARPPGPRRRARARPGRRDHGRRRWSPTTARSSTRRPRR